MNEVNDLMHLLGELVNNNLAVRAVFEFENFAVITYQVTYPKLFFFMGICFRTEKD